MDGIGMDGLQWAPKKRTQAGMQCMNSERSREARRDKRQEESFICEPLKHAGWHCINSVKGVDCCPSSCLFFY